MRHFIISGASAVGKTTLIREAILPYMGRVGGFLTLERRGGPGEREGFDLLRLPEDARYRMAGKDIASPCKVGKYGVDLAVLDTQAASALEEALTSEAIGLVVIDGIGPIEVCSEKLRKSVFACLGQRVKPVLATVRHNSKPFCDDLAKLPGCEVVFLDRDSYPQVKLHLKTWLDLIFK